METDKEKKKGIREAKEDWPEGSQYRIELLTGRVLFCSKPKLKYLRQVGEMSGINAVQNPLAYMAEVISLQAVALFRANGDEVDITNRKALMEEILSFDEAMQVVNNPNLIGLELEKKIPIVTSL